jgi:hypothetical protein
MESRFDRDFSNVRVHDDARAAQSANAVSAEAFTVGKDVVFAEGRYAPTHTAGRTLLAHELAHVVQQRGASDVAGGLISPSNADAEMTADQAANAVSAGDRAHVHALNQPRTVQRKPADESAAPHGESDAKPQDTREQIIALAESDVAADRQRALDLIVSTYYERPANFGGVFYRPDYRPVNAAGERAQDIGTGPVTGHSAYGGSQIIEVGQRFFEHFRERYAQRVRTIGHELQHVSQRSPAKNRSVQSTLGGAGVGAAIGGALGAGAIGIAAATHASLSAGLIGGVIGGLAAVGGVIGGIVDPFASQADPIRNRDTREFLAIHWVLTANVRGLDPLPPRQALQNINYPKEGALDRYRHMPPEDQKRYRREYEEILDLKRRLESDTSRSGEHETTP